MPAGAVGQVLQLVAGDQHRLHDRRHAGRYQRLVPVAGRQHGTLTGDELHRRGGLGLQAHIGRAGLRRPVCRFRLARDERHVGRAREGRAAIARRPRLNLLDVPTGVVVGEYRAAVVVRGAGVRQVVGRREDRVGRIPAVDRSVAIAVHSVCRPCRGDELHRTAGAGRVGRALARARRIAVAAVVALDLADRGEDRPVDAETLSGRLVKTQVLRRDLPAGKRRRRVGRGFHRNVGSAVQGRSRDSRHSCQRYQYAEQQHGHAKRRRARGTRSGS